MSPRRRSRSRHRSKHATKQDHLSSWTKLSSRYSNMISVYRIVANPFSTYDIEGIGNPEPHKVPGAPLPAFRLNYFPSSAFDTKTILRLEWYLPGLRSKLVNINWALVRPGSEVTASLSITRATLVCFTFSMMAAEKVVWCWQVLDSIEFMEPSLKVLNESSPRSEEALEVDSVTGGSSSWNGQPYRNYVALRQICSSTSTARLS